MTDQPPSQAEARDVIDLRADGAPVSEIVRHIDDRYGAITAPTS